MDLERALELVISKTYEDLIVEELTDSAKKVAVENIIQTLDLPVGVVATVNADGSAVTLSKVGMTDVSVLLQATFKLSDAAQDRADQEAVATDKASLEIGYTADDSATSVTEALALPSVGASDTEIHWSSSNPASISADGVVNRPSFTMGDAQVTLTVTIQKGKASETKIFELTVKKLPKTEAEEALEQAIRELTTSLANVDLSEAEGAQAAYRTARGDTAETVYTSITTSMQALEAAKVAGQGVLNQGNPTLEDVQGALNTIQQHQLDLRLKVNNLNTATEAVLLKFTEAKIALQAAIASTDLTTAEQTQSEYENKGGDIQAIVYTAVSAAITNVKNALTTAQNLDVNTAGLDEIKNATQSLQTAVQTLEERVTALQEATNAMVFPELMSKAITEFNFSTQYAGQVVGNSKSMHTSNFQSQPKSFTISDGKGNVIPVNLNWNIVQNEYATTPAASIGSAVESVIQQYFVDKEGTNGLYNRTVSAAVNWNGGSEGDTFRIQSFQAGSTQSITLGGPDWAYLFDQQTSHGTDEDKSKNRTFSISDGTNTAVIMLNGNYGDMTGFVNHLNWCLQADQVKISVEKSSETTFKLIGTKTNTTISIGESDKNQFFN